MAEEGCYRCEVAKQKCVTEVQCQAAKESLVVGNARIEGV